MRRTALAACFAVIFTGLLAGPALAGKPTGGSSTSSSLQLVLLDSTDGVAHYGQQVTFKVSTTATDQPQVKLECFQGGARVLYGSAGFYPDYPWPWAQNFQLSSGSWTSGAADCTGTMYYYNGRKYLTLKTLGFHVEP